MGTELWQNLAVVLAPLLGNASMVPVTYIICTDSLRKTSNTIDVKSNQAGPELTQAQGCFNSSGGWTGAFPIALSGKGVDFAQPPTERSKGVVFCPLQELATHHPERALIRLRALKRTIAKGNPQGRLGNCPRIRGDFGAQDEIQCTQQSFRLLLSGA